jgi:diguanylate cyclase (GGDEF)-like protein
MTMQVDIPTVPEQITLPEDQQELDYRAQLAELGKRDLLTGLFNRQFFIRLLEAQLQKEQTGLARGLLYLRIDDFSDIEERFGPINSDRLLKQVGRFIGEKIGKNSVAARFGGTMFTVFAVRRSFGEIELLGQQLREAVAGRIFQVGSLSTSLTVSIGMADLLAAEGCEVASLITLAQASAREVREEGGNQARLNRSMEQDAEGQLLDRGWFRKIKSALESNNFQLAYQPIASLSGEGSNIYDVLVRMLDDNGEEIMPADFIPAAERTGMMHEIDRWVIDYAFRIAAQRHKEGKASLFFLRVSEATLLDEELGEWIAARYRTRRVPANSIVFQVEEVVVQKHLAAAKSLAELAGSLDCGFATGHFGTGEKSERLVDVIDMDYVILDGTCIENLEDTAATDRLKRLIDKAEDKAVRVIAAHVENASEVALLCRLGVNYVQGFYLQEPEEVIIDNVLLPD